MRYDSCYTKDDIIRMKRYKYALKYNVDFNYQKEQKDLFKSLECTYPDIRYQTNIDAGNEYKRRFLDTMQKPIDEFVPLDVEIWTMCYFANFNKEISDYERKYGSVDLELSQEFNNFISNKNNVVNQERLYVKETQVLSLSQLISSIASVLEIASALNKEDVPYLDEGVLGLKGIAYAIKERNGTITNKDKIAAGLDLMFYVSNKNLKDEEFKNNLKVTSGIIGLCINFFLGNK